MKLTQPQITYLTAVERGEIVTFSTNDAKPKKRTLRIKNGRETKAQRATVESLEKLGLIRLPSAQVGLSQGIKHVLTENGQSELARHAR